MKVSSRIFLIFYLVSCISSCVYLIPFIAPKPEEFKLYKQKTIGLQGSVVAKTNGLYFFLYQQEAILSYDDYKKGNIHKTFAGYYRFKRMVKCT